MTQEKKGLRRRSVMAAATLPWVLSPAWAGPDGPDATRFFRDEETLSADVSPDGQRVALRTVAKHRGVMLTVLELATMLPTVLHSQEAADACNVAWISPSRLVFSVEERRVPAGRINSGPGLFAINADGTVFRQLVERRETLQLARVDGGGISGAVATGAAPKGPSMGQEGMGFKQVADAPNVKNLRNDGADRLQAWNTYVLAPVASHANDSLLMWRPTGAKGAWLEVLELNAQTGRAHMVDLPGAVLSAHADMRGDLRAAVVQEAGRVVTVWRDPTTGAWRPLGDCAPEAESDWAIQCIDPRGLLYVSARRGRDMLALWAYDVATGRWSDAPLAQSPQFDVAAQVLVNQGKVVGFRFTIDAEVTQWLDSDFKSLQQQLDQLLPRTVNRIAVPTHGQPTVVLVEAFSDTQPKVYLLFSRETRKLSKLGSLRPDITSKEMTGMDLQRFAARDGLDIPVWVSRPKAQAPKPLPTVVVVHDALHADNDPWAWDAAVQFLVARGYAVLRPAVRGTRGLGLRHFRAGVGQVGLGISDDIADTVQWAVAQGIADPKRIALAGAGFGATSALMTMARYPQLLRCAVAWSALTDLTRWEEGERGGVLDTPMHSKPGTRAEPRLGIATGDLAARSPLGRAAALKQPLLLAHGDSDRAIPLEQAQVFRKAVQANHAGSEWIVYAGEGRVLRDPADITDFYNRMARFLETQLAL